MTDENIAVRTQADFPRPQFDEQCAQCKHRFALHWTTYDNKMTGCAGPATLNCVCKGFTMIFKWEHDHTICDVWQLEK